MGFAHDRVAKALILHSKGAGSIPKVSFLFKSHKIFLHIYIFMRGTRWRYHFPMKNFGKLEKIEK
jgi:hypothetical protein